MTSGELSAPLTAAAHGTSRQKTLILPSANPPWSLPSARALAHDRQLLYERPGTAPSRTMARREGVARRMRGRSWASGTTRVRTPLRMTTSKAILVALQAQPCSKHCCKSNQFCESLKCVICSMTRNKLANLLGICWATYLNRQHSTSAHLEIAGLGTGL